MGKKHFTKKELDAREEAKEALKRGNVEIEKPESIRKNKEASQLWNKIITDMTGIDILDNLDSNVLATFCHIELLKNKALEDGDVALYNRLSNTALSYVKELGLSPHARVKLATKRANDKVEKSEETDMFG